MTILPYLGRRHRLPVEREFECTGIQSALNRRPTVSVVKEDETPSVQKRVLKTGRDTDDWGGGGRRRDTLTGADPRGLPTP